MVCMGNICRSPTAEGVLRQLLAERAPDLGAVVDSAGTHGYHVGDPPDDRAIAHAMRRGVDLRACRARRLVAEDFERFDWVLCMDEANLRAAGRIRGESGPVGSAELRLLLDFAPAGSASEVPDPYYGGDEDFERVLDLVAVGSLGLIGELLRRAGSSPFRTQEA
jgi:protein-tyrosine phosphatase